VPAGPLREPLADGLLRADAAIRVGTDDAEVDRSLPASLPRLEAELRPAAHAPDLAGRRVLAFAGIGRPEKLFITLRRAGAELVDQAAFPDHHRYRRAEVERLLARARRADALCVTSTKDAVRLPADLRERIEVMPVVVAWLDPAALDRVLGKALRVRSRNITM
jgi:tetraacyldisaccharide 4'-kinase